MVSNYDLTVCGSMYTARLQKLLKSSHVSPNRLRLSVPFPPSAERTTNDFKARAEPEHGDTTQRATGSVGTGAEPRSLHLVS